MVKREISMRPAGRLANPARVIQMMEAGIRVGLQRAGEVLQMLAGMFTPAIR